MEAKSHSLERYVSIPKEWYFLEGDREEIMSWDENVAEDIWDKMKKNIFKKACAGIRYDLCPFCFRNNYRHIKDDPNATNPSCLACGYGKRHGVCTHHHDVKSDFVKILCSFEKNRVNIYKTMSNDYYKNLANKLEEKYMAGATAK